ncbi:IS3 family transposase, partial [Persicirhabdus sediminis]
GSQYTSCKLRKLLGDHKFKQSMSAKGNCYDNATCESFFGSLKAELLPSCGYFASRELARKAIFEYIEGFYNTYRRHSSLGYISPFEYLKKQNQVALAA